LCGPPCWVDVEPSGSSAQPRPGFDETQLAFGDLLERGAAAIQLLGGRPVGFPQRGGSHFRTGRLTQLLQAVEFVSLVHSRTCSHDASWHQLVAAAPNLVDGAVVGGCHEYGLASCDGGGDDIDDELTLSRTWRSRRDREPSGHRGLQYRALTGVGGQWTDDE